MDGQLRRVAENEVRFRAVNERVHAGGGSSNGAFEVLCECGDANCTDLITVSPAEYERARAEPTQFIVKPGHEVGEVEVEVEVAEGDRYEVVRKIGTAGEIAREHDPRS